MSNPKTDGERSGFEVIEPSPKAEPRYFLPDMTMEMFVRRYLGVARMNGSEALFCTADSTAAMTLFLGWYLLKSEAFLIYCHLWRDPSDGPYGTPLEIVDLGTFDLTAKGVELGILAEDGGRIVLPDWREAVAGGKVGRVKRAALLAELRECMDACLDESAEYNGTLWWSLADRTWDRATKLGLFDSTVIGAFEAATVPDVKAASVECRPYEPGYGQEEFIAGDWAALMASTSQKIKLPKGIRLTSDQWDDIVWCQPTRVRECPDPQALSAWTWCKVLGEKAAPDDACPYEKFRGVHWLMLLDLRPELAQARVDLKTFNKSQRDAWKAKTAKGE